MTTTNPEGRAIERLVVGQRTSDGAGVKLTRVLTQDLQQRLDPFLMLDFFGSEEAEDYVGGFPDHPHRGFETVTYMLHGRMRHRDSAGNQGLLQDGGVQWMTAGRGVIHSEMPEQSEGLMNGFQLWLNLPSKEKMTAPWYRDIQSAEIPEYHREDGLTVRVIAGEHQGVSGLVRRDATQPLFLDIQNRADGTLTLTQPVPAVHNAFVYAYVGDVSVLTGGQAQTVAKNRMAILANQHHHVVLELPAQSRAILVAGQPLGEPIVQYGPFVMNTRDEVMQAVQDYQQGVLA
ncbi:MAG: pirin family protein [Burkholderiaceae bacterium]